MFDPDAWKGRDEELKFDQCALSEDELRKYARIATEVRKVFKSNAGLALTRKGDGSPQDIEEALRQMPRLTRNYLSVPRPTISKEMLYGHEHNSSSSKRKRLSLTKVNAQTRLQILKMAAAKMRTHREIAELFNVQSSAVASLTSALKRSKSTIVKRRMKEL